MRSRHGHGQEAINHRSPCKDAARDDYAIRRLEVLRKARDSCSFSSVYDNFGARFMADLVSFGGLSDSQLP